jgi:spore coat protein JC
MWIYEKKLEYPIKINTPNPKMAKIIMSQYGGPDGEIGASLRYLSQRFSMVTPEAKATLNDIGTEELVPACYTWGSLGYISIWNPSGSVRWPSGSSLM